MFANCLGDSADLCPSWSHWIHRQKEFERREFLASHPPRVFGNGDQIRRFGDTAIGDLIRLRLSYRNVMESTLAEFTTENRIEVGAIDNYITSVTPTDGHPRKEFDEGSHRPLPSGSVRPPRAQSHHSTLRGSVANNDVESHPIMELTDGLPRAGQKGWPARRGWRSSARGYPPGCGVYALSHAYTHRNRGCHHVP